MFESLPAELLWFIIGFVLLLSELAIPSFILMFFGIGAWATSLAALVGLAPNLAIQLIIFAAVSVLSLVLFRRKAKSMGRGHVAMRSAHNKDDVSLVGSIGVVIEPIQPGQLGKVELHGTAWNATSETAIKKGDFVEVISRDNLTLTVKPR